MIVAVPSRMPEDAETSRPIQNGCGRCGYAGATMSLVRSARAVDISCSPPRSEAGASECDCACRAQVPAWFRLVRRDGITPARVNQRAGSLSPD